MRKAMVAIVGAEAIRSLEAAKALPASSSPIHRVERIGQCRHAE